MRHLRLRSQDVECLQDSARITGFDTLVRLALEPGHSK
jgi:hypothetical protein